MTTTIEEYVPTRGLPTPLRLALAVRLDELPDALGGLPLAGPERDEAYAEAATIASEALSECQRLERLISDIRALITDENIEAVMYDDDALVDIADLVDGYGA